MGRGMIKSRNVQGRMVGLLREEKRILRNFPEV